MSTATATFIDGLIETGSLQTATERATEIFYTLATAGVRVSLDHHPAKRQFKLYGVSQADLIKTICAEFEIKLDQYQRRYAELYIKYAK